MPRGFLKNLKGVNRKKHRGGSSHHDKPRRASQRRSCGGRKFQNKRGRTAPGGKEVDFDATTCIPLTQKATTQPSDTRKNQPRLVATVSGECAICLETLPLLPLFQNCKHPPACRSCLRQLYVKHAQSDVNQYPLQCFHPSCDLKLGSSQLDRLGFSTSERTKHHRYTELAKGYRPTFTKNNRVFVHCPACDHPRVVSEKEILQRDGFVEELQFFSCRACTRSFGRLLRGPVGQVQISMLDDGQAQQLRTRLIQENRGGKLRISRQIRAMFNRPGLERISRLTQRLLHSVLLSLPPDSIGKNDGWARCPRCGILVSKGNGCDHMRCFCGFDFSWAGVRGILRSSR